MRTTDTKDGVNPLGKNRRRGKKGAKKFRNLQEDAVLFEQHINSPKDEALYVHSIAERDAWKCLYAFTPAPLQFGWPSKYENPYGGLWGGAGYAPMVKCEQTDRFGHLFIRWSRPSVKTELVTIQIPETETTGEYKIITNQRGEKVLSELQRETRETGRMVEVLTTKTTGTEGTAGTGLGTGLDDVTDSGLAALKKAFKYFSKRCPLSEDIVDTEIDIDKVGKTLSNVSKHIQSLHENDMLVGEIDDTLTALESALYSIANGTTPDGIEILWNDAFLVLKRAMHELEQETDARDNRTAEQRQQDYVAAYSEFVKEQLGLSVLRECRKFATNEDVLGDFVTFIWSQLFSDNDPETVITSAKHNYEHSKGYKRTACPYRVEKDEWRMSDDEIENDDVSLFDYISRQWPNFKDRFDKRNRKDATSKAIGLVDVDTGYDDFSADSNADSTDTYIGKQYVSLTMSQMNEAYLNFDRRKERKKNGSDTSVELVKTVRGGLEGKVDIMADEITARTFFTTQRPAYLPLFEDRLLGLSYVEIGKRHNMSPDAVRKGLDRCFYGFRVDMDEYRANCVSEYEIEAELAELAEAFGDMGQFLW